MSDQPPYPPNQPGWGQQPPQGPPPQQPGWGQQPPPPPPPGGGWGGPPPGGQPPGGGWGGPPPGPANYDAATAIGYGWRAFKMYAGPLLAATLLAILVPLAVQGVGVALGGGQVFKFEASSGGGVDYEFSGVGLVFQLLAMLVSIFLSAAVIRLGLDIVDGNEVSVGGMFTRINFGQVLIAAILLSIATLIGTVLCLLPGIVVAILTFLTNYFIVGKQQDAITAIKSSVSMVTSNFGALLLLFVLSVLCLLAGLLACCVGLVVAAPVVGVATAYTFRTLQSEPVRPL